MKTWKKIVLSLIMLLVLTCTFIAYLRPDFIVDLANRFFLCF